MGEIKEVFSDIREKIGDKGFFIFIGVAVIFGLYNLVKGSSNSEDNLTPVTTISSYPDAVTNANVIIDTLQDSLEYSENRIVGNINNTYKDLSEQIGGNFEATNDFINKGFDSQGKLLEENFDDLHGELDGINTNISSGFANVQASQNAINSAIGSMKNDIASNTNTIAGLSGTVSGLSGTVSGLSGTVSGLSGTVSGLSGTVSGLSGTVSGLKDTVSNLKTSNKSSGTSSPAPQKKNDTLTYKTQSGLNTSTSIVDALKATGADSSFSARANLYYANGGKGTYTGSASQNTQMLSSLKAGTLKKA